MSEAISATSSFHLIGADVERLERSPPRTHRAWSPDLKARIIEETFAPGANVLAIARSHDLAPSQLFAWRRKALASGMVTPLASEDSGAMRFTRFDAVRGNMVEIIVGDVVIRARSGVDAGHLAMVLRAVRSA
ncbi:transposase [Aquamicrobium terrae]|uniref:Transposase n=1 Tax=Aquamicrobium terrae TaxID=1324945 RepID=A0ABV2N0D7_9HYPH